MEEGGEGKSASDVCREHRATGTCTVFAGI